MLVVGADVHKRTHTFVAVDEVGKKLGAITVKADGKGFMTRRSSGPSGSSGPT